MSSSISDEEKAQPLPIPESEFLVKWEDNDPLNPRNLSALRRWLITMCVSIGALAVWVSQPSNSDWANQATMQHLRIFYICFDLWSDQGRIPLFKRSSYSWTLTLRSWPCWRSNVRESIVRGTSAGYFLSSYMNWSKEQFYGRRYIYIISMILYLIWNIPCATAQNIETLLIGRFFDGLCGSAFMSVAAGTITDLFSPHEIQAPMMLFTLSPFLGPVLGPLLGGFINSYVSWRWTFYVMLIWSGVLSVVFVFVPETYHPVLLSQKAAAIRKSTGNESYYSASERARASRPLSKVLVESLYRPFQLLFLEPMCTLLCIYSALLLGILYLFFGAFPLVFTTNHGFNLWQTGLTFLGLVIGQFLAVLVNPLFRRHYLRLVAEQRAKSGKEGENQRPEPEFRLPPAIVGGILVPISLFVSPQCLNLWSSSKH